MSMKEAYEKKMRAQLDEWDAEIRKLKARAEQAQADGQLEYYKQIEDLRQRQQHAQEKLEELQQASDTAWQDLRAGMESAWDSMAEAMRKASSRFK
ncbi:coiled coil domain-containing protein [Marinobacterium aestuariivivens]|uniref:Coiled coil domain-containing protein n=1 Tax=Marinobacterium aestuariivivens TaxID=1698799 RepID=A0ABW2A941_9GAMM